MRTLAFRALGASKCLEIGASRGRRKLREQVARLVSSHFNMELGSLPVFGLQMDSLRYRNFQDQDMRCAYFHS